MQVNLGNQFEGATVPSLPHKEERAKFLVYFFPCAVHVLDWKVVVAPVLDHIALFRMLPS